MTPMMTQWRACKNQAPNALLLFRLGDFYEAFYEDAQTISQEIQLTLTSRGGIPMCGVPFHSADTYIDKLLAKGYKIAIAEQTEDPKKTKGLVKREVQRVVSPGALVQSDLLKEKKNNYFASIFQIGSIFGLGVIDVSTSELRVVEVESGSDLLDELCKLRPAELLIDPSFSERHPPFLEELSHLFPFVLNTQSPLDMSYMEQLLLSHFQKTNLKDLHLQGKPAAIGACATLLHYFQKTLLLPVEQITDLQADSLNTFLSLDRSTLRNLDLLDSTREKNSSSTLLDAIDRTLTPMGGRLIRDWIQRPLLSIDRIIQRQETVALFLKDSQRALNVAERLEPIRDLDRLIMKISARFAHPRDLLGLGLSLLQIPQLQDLLREIPSLPPPSLEAIAPLAQKITSSLCEAPPLRIGEAPLFRSGLHPELDRLRAFKKEAIEWIAQHQSQLREETGIKTLKVSYTRAFGYYIEVSRAQCDKVPSSFFRKQTLTNGERFVTEELRDFEHRILTADERTKGLESELYEELRSETAQNASSIQKWAKWIAQIDVLLSFARAAKELNLVRPTINDSQTLSIREGRHLIVEKSIGKAGFIANDTLFGEEQQLHLITGPNMAGKSTYIRQVALIVILAQMGSFIPARSAEIGIVDKIFSRIGASDDLARGQSTFMVEMSETAHILKHATSRSLVLLDEIGRGTSTYDGIAIAWSVAEYLLTVPHQQAKTLFATHYWELTQLAQEFPHACNYQTAVQEIDSGIVFLRKIIPGGTDKSYGIHVAKLAGLPPKALARARQMLQKLEAKESSPKRPSSRQLSLFPPATSPIFQELRNLDLNRMTPLEALQKLRDLQILESSQ